MDLKPYLTHCLDQKIKPEIGEVDLQVSVKPDALVFSYIGDDFYFLQSKSPAKISGSFLDLDFENGRLYLGKVDVGEDYRMSAIANKQVGLKELLEVNPQRNYDQCSFELSDICVNSSTGILK